MDPPCSEEEKKPAAAENDEEEEEEREEETEMEEERRLCRWYIHFLTLEKRSCKISIVVQDYLQLFRKRRSRRRRRRYGGGKVEQEEKTTEEDCTRALPCFSGVGAPALARISIVKIGIASRNVSTLAR